MSSALMCVCVCVCVCVLPSALPLHYLELFFFIFIELLDSLITSLNLFLILHPIWL